MDKEQCVVWVACGGRVMFNFIEGVVKGVAGIAVGALEVSMMVPPLNAFDDEADNPLLSAKLLGEAAEKLKL